MFLYLHVLSCLYTSEAQFFDQFNAELMRRFAAFYRQMNVLHQKLL